MDHVRENFGFIRSATSIKFYSIDSILIILCHYLFGQCGKAEYVHDNVHVLKWLPAAHLAFVVLGVC